MPVLLRGAIEDVRHAGDVLSFVRRLGEERVLCVFNLSTAPAAFELSGWAADENDVVLPPWGTMVLPAARSIRSIAA